MKHSITAWQNYSGWRILAAVLLILVVLTLGGCQGDDQNTNALNGRVILWHSWSTEDEVILDQALADFLEIQPGVEVVVIGLAPDELLPEFKQSTSQGLGPDLVFASSNSIRELAEDGLIRPVDADESSRRNYTNTVVKAISYDNEVFGVPAFLLPNALYYNSEQVVTPAETLTTLREEADQGKRLAFVPRFEAAYWGIQAFGEGLFDAQGNFTLAESGFVQWLSWLSEVQNEPGIILNVDADALQDLFVEGGIAYYVAGPEKQTELTAAMGENTFQVTTLPAGPKGSSGPLLPAETILLNTFSSEEQAKIATSLALFLTNQQQSIRFMREASKVPANPGVAVDPRLYPIVAGFSSQARTAVSLPGEIELNKFFAAGDKAYASVLSGSLSPDEAVCSFGQEVIIIQGYGPDQVSLPEDCEFPTG